MAAGEWTGYEDGDMKLDIAGAVFNVHRTVIVQASPVWKAMLTGHFAEATESAIHLDGDDPRVARLCIELIYSTHVDSDLDWGDVGTRVVSDRDAFDEFVDKYELRGVKRLVTQLLDVWTENGREKRKMRKLKKENRRLQDKVSRLREKVRAVASSCRSHR